MAICFLNKMCMQIDLYRLNATTVVMFVATARAGAMSAPAGAARHAKQQTFPQPPDPALLDRSAPFPSNGDEAGRNLGATVAGSRVGEARLEQLSTQTLAPPGAPREPSQDSAS